MIIFSFAWRKNGHSPCNIRLAYAAKRIRDELNEELIIFGQRTVTAVVSDPEFHDLHELNVNQIEKTPGYEGSENLVNRAAITFREEGITEVIPVAHRFLHLFKCVALIRAAGFQVPRFFWVYWMIGKIGFDPLSEQPWTRSRFKLLVYTIRQVVFKYQGPPELSEP